MKTHIKSLFTCLGVRSTQSRACPGVASCGAWILPALIGGLGLLPALPSAMLAQSPPADSFTPMGIDVVGSLAVQPDGKILVVSGSPGYAFSRLNADGTLDTSFNQFAYGGYGVHSVAVQADGKILVGFARSGTANAISRLNADGMLDTSFNQDAGGLGAVSSMAVQADGKILVGGVNGIIRLNGDGTSDTNFIYSGFSGDVYCLAVQVDGKILVGGQFFTLGGQSRDGLGRLNADGTLDTTFDPGNSPAYSSREVYSLVLQTDGKIFVGGNFGTLGGQTRSELGRLNADGTLDASFNPGADNPVYGLVLQADGKILVGGQFTTLGGQSRNAIGRLHADGTLDASFNPGVGGYVYLLALQTDGRILVGGSFTTLGGQSRTNLGRLNNTDSATQSLSFDGSSLTWMRGGTSPEAWRTTFEYSPDGVSWPIRAGLRIPGGWQITGLALPANTSIRARGYIGGQYGDAGWFVETMIGSLGITTQPASLTNNAGTNAVFSVGTIGARPLSYQWRKDGEDLTDGGNISGVATTSMTLSNILGGDSGNYSAVISNASGSVTSVVATLTVIDPLITSQPASQDKNLGDSVALSVAAIGTQPLSYQWRQNGSAKAGATQSSLTRTNLQGADAGSFEVVVSNAWGSATSAVAMLSVNAAVPDTLNPGANSDVYCLAVQTDGKVVAGGGFYTLGRQSRSHIGRLNADGTLDGSFNPVANGVVDSLALQTGGKILVGGQFTTLGGQGRNNIGRLNADGTLDTGFNPGADGVVDSLALQADGKIVVAGQFTTLGGQSRNNIGRLNADGSLDTSFNPGTDGGVSCLALQADGNILVGGNFTTLNAQSRSCIGRLNADGSLDSTFTAGVQGSSYFGPSVYSLAVQADGRILVGGYFTTLGGQSRSAIGRLNTDGTLDPSFNPGAGDYSYSFYTPTVYSLAVQADGEVLVGGFFSTLGGQGRDNLGRLITGGSANQSLTFDGSVLTWLRGGTSPEVWRTTFEYSPDGASWTTSAGTRIPGGWQITGLALPTNTTIRARGYAAGGYQNGSAWFVENIIGSPVILPAFVTTQPATGISITGAATLHGSVNPGLRETLAWFELGSDGNYGDIVGVTNLAGSTNNLALSTALSGLSVGEVYHYRLVAWNELGIVYGDDQSFMEGVAPTVVTLAATGLTTNGAMLNATINPNGPDTTVYFRWGTTSSYGQLTPVTDLGRGSAPANFNFLLGGLTPGTIYHYQIVASNVLGGASGADLSFLSGPWAQTTAPSSAGWQTVAASADGTRLVAAGVLTAIYTSTNSGITWRSNNTIIDRWTSVSSSADGVKLAAVVGGYQAYGLIYTSTNSGASWTTNHAPTLNWRSVASSADGIRLVAVSGYEGRIYTSADGGASWTSNAAPAQSWNSVASSADGSKLVAIAYQGQICASTNSGASWALTSAPNGFWWSVASSADGNKLVAAQGGYPYGGYAGPIYVSTNSGATWTQTSAPFTPWFSVASSADGTRLAAAVSGAYGSQGPIYTSTNSGTTWTQSGAPAAGWTSIASSADGNKLAAACYAVNTGIYTLQTTPTSLLSLTPLDHNALLSWTIPSWDFGLQQNADLTTTNWTDVPTPPVLNLTNLQNQVIVSPPGGNTFYRLKH